MEKKLRLLLFSLLSAWMLSVNVAIAQREVTLTSIPHAILFSIDRQDNIYYVNQQQDVKKLSDTLLVYSSPRRRTITHLEAWNTAKIFAFSKEFQEYTLLDRYLTEISTTAFDVDQIGFASFATLALDGHIWVFDNGDFSIKKVSIQTNKTMLTTNLNQIMKPKNNEITFMKEYGNFLYLCTQQNGILVFDNLGTYKKQLSYDGVPFIGFKDDEAYFPYQGKLVFFHLQQLAETTLPCDPSLKAVLLTGTDSGYSIPKP